MKSARLWILFPGVVCLALWAMSCSSPNKSDKGPEAGWVSDTAIVRAILDTNGITDVSVVTVGPPPDNSEVGEDYRVASLILIPEKLGGDSIETLTEDIGKLTALTFINLDGNRIKELPSSIGKLTNVTTLTASNNKLSSLPEEIGDMESLRNLKLGGNKLSSIPSSIGQLDSLEDLVLSDNEMTSLPSSVADLAALDKLHLDNNKLTAEGLPGRLTELDSLEWLNVANNNICNPGSEIDAWLDSYHDGDAWKTGQDCP